jgi:hypothetical protein
LCVLDQKQKPRQNDIQTDRETDEMQESTVTVTAEQVARSTKEILQGRGWRKMNPDGTVAKSKKSTPKRKHEDVSAIKATLASLESAVDKSVVEQHGLKVKQKDINDTLQTVIDDLETLGEHVRDIKPAHIVSVKFKAQTTDRMDSMLTSIEKLQVQHGQLSREIARVADSMELVRALCYHDNLRFMANMKRRCPHRISEVCDCDAKFISMQMEQMDKLARGEIAGTFETVILSPVIMHPNSFEWPELRRMNRTCGDADISELARFGADECRARGRFKHDECIHEDPKFYKAENPSYPEEILSRKPELRRYSYRIKHRNDVFSADGNLSTTSFNCLI